jgi:hypothetical protein
MSVFEYWERHPDLSKIHDDAMEGLTRLASAAILAAYDFRSFARWVMLFWQPR